MKIQIPVKNIEKEKPELYKWVLAFNTQFTDCIKAYYMIWNEGAGEDEYHAWKIEDDVDGSLEEYPYWWEIGGACVLLRDQMEEK